MRAAAGHETPPPLMHGLVLRSEPGRCQRGGGGTPRGRGGGGGVLFGSVMLGLMLLPLA